MTLKASIEQVHWRKDLAQTFTEVTGLKAVYKDNTLEEYFACGIFPNPDGKVGHSADPNNTSLQTYHQNFTGFWNMFKARGAMWEIQRYGICVARGIFSRHALTDCLEIWPLILMYYNFHIPEENCTSALIETIWHRH